MFAKIVILSEDAVFARMLKLEFELLHLHTAAVASMEAHDIADVLILDLDSAVAPQPEQYRVMIGFSRRPATSSEDARSCSMILRRPFRMSLLRREVLAQTGMGKPFETAERPPEPTVAFYPDQDPELYLEPADRALISGGKKIVFSQQEFRILQCLLENRGKPVSRETLADLIGQNGGNKTEVYICFLRRKTDGLPGGRLIRTVRGAGYMIDQKQQRTEK